MAQKSAMYGRARAAMSARDPFRFRFQSRSVRLNIYATNVSSYTSEC